MARESDGRASRARRPARAPGADGMRITLDAMRFHTLVGILEHERRQPQPLEIDLSVWCGVGDIVDYRSLYATVAARVARGPVEYLETAAAEIADAILADERITRVRVTLRKPHVALPGPLAGAEVELSRSRDGAD